MGGAIVGAIVGAFDVAAADGVGLGAARLGNADGEDEGTADPHAPASVTTTRATAMRRRKRPREARFKCWLPIVLSDRPTRVQGSTAVNGP